MLLEATASMLEHAQKCGVPPEIHSEDYIYKFLTTHPQLSSKSAEYYFSDGMESARKLRSVIATDTPHSLDSRISMLEFASGYGCVTRHLKNVLPELDVTACDIHPQAMDFISSRLATNVAASVADPEAFDLKRQFDIVFALSFFSHMPKHAFAPWLAALFRHVAPGGSLIFTTHGEVSLRKIWQESVELDADGFWFHAESEQGDLEASSYGTTISSPVFVTRAIYKSLAAPLAVLQQGHWWGHQDLYVVAKR